MNFHGVINERKIESAAQKVTGLERVSDKLDGLRASLPIRSSDPAGGRHLLVAGAVAPSPPLSRLDAPIRGGLWAWCAHALGPRSLGPVPLGLLWGIGPGWLSTARGPSSCSDHRLHRSSSGRWGGGAPRLWFRGASQVAQRVKNPSAVQETQEKQVQSLGWEDPLEEGRATHSSVLAWRVLMDRGAWRATVRGVAMSRTRLSRSTRV